MNLVITLRQSPLRGCRHMYYAVTNADLVTLTYDDIILASVSCSHPYDNGLTISMCSCATRAPLRISYHNL